MPNAGAGDQTYCPHRGQPGHQPRTLTRLLAWPGLTRPTRLGPSPMPHSSSLPPSLCTACNTIRSFASRLEVQLELNRSVHHVRYDPPHDPFGSKALSHAVPRDPGFPTAVSVGCAAGVTNPLTKVGLRKPCRPPTQPV